MMETQFSSPIYVVPQKMLQEQQQQSLLKLSSNPTLATAAPKYRVILLDVNKINKVLFNEKIQIAKSKPIATVVGSKRPAATLPPLSPISMKTDIKEEQEEDDEGAPMRKRANLDHLSPEERLQRRKLKNRVAAQNARDKKKAQTEEMEKMIEEIRMEKQKLVDENARLQAARTCLQAMSTSWRPSGTTVSRTLTWTSVLIELNDKCHLPSLYRIYVLCFKFNKVFIV